MKIEAKNLGLKKNKNLKIISLGIIIVQKSKYTLIRKANQLNIQKTLDKNSFHAIKHTTSYIFLYSNFPLKNLLVDSPHLPLTCFYTSDFS